ncbi:MAG: MBL fold metallo-hydrolase [Chloroflexi bacterium]|nr:MBL fold metallo-hydrolase [Chloroflexota bacterium]
MEITWLGHSCFRLRGRDATVITDPYDKSIGYSLGKPSAQIVTVSHDHPGHNAVSNVGGSPQVLLGPGEYEIARVLITGIRTFHDAEQGKKRGKNTVYLIAMDELTICHLGDLGHVPTAEQVEALSNVDILMTPVGGESTIDAAGAAEVANLLEPKVIIPMHYKTQATDRNLEPLDRFLKEMGLKEVEPQPRLSITKATLPHETQVVVLSYQR